MSTYHFLPVSWVDQSLLSTLYQLGQASEFADVAQIEVTLVSRGLFLQLVPVEVRL